MRRTSPPRLIKSTLGTHFDCCDARFTSETGHSRLSSVRRCVRHVGYCSDSYQIGMRPHLQRRANCGSSMSTWRRDVNRAGRNFGSAQSDLQLRRPTLRRANRAFPKVSRAAARISSDKLASSTARASVSAPIIPASVAIARLRRLAAVPPLSRCEKRSSCARTCAVTPQRIPSPCRAISPHKAAMAQPSARLARRIRDRAGP